MSKIQNKLYELSLVMDDTILHPKFKKQLKQFLIAVEAGELSPDEVEQKDNELITLFDELHELEVVDDEKIANEKQKTSILEAQINDTQLKEQEIEAQKEKDKQTELERKRLEDEPWTLEKQITYLKSIKTISFTDLEKIGIKATGRNIDLGEVYLARIICFYRYEVRT